jgi:hypothetical protein
MPSSGGATDRGATRMVALPAFEGTGSDITGC